MKFKAVETISGSIGAVFDDFADIARIERELTDRGVGLERLDGEPGIGVGSSWRTVVPVRGRQREATARLVSLERPDRLRLEGKSGGMLIETDVEFEAVGPQATEVTVIINLRARSMTAKLLLSSLRLARPRLVRGMRRRVTKAARACEERLSA